MSGYCKQINLQKVHLNFIKITYNSNDFKKNKKAMKNTKKSVETQSLAHRKQNFIQQFEL